MVFENIEKLKQKYTDKFVVVDERRPELRRFKGQTGTVRTVNMSGRALVEFDGHNNTGWYDIELDYLNVIDAPLPKPEKEKAEKEKAKPTPEKAKAPAGADKASPKAAPEGAKMSMEEMLAAARGEKSGGTAEATTPPAAESKAATADKPAAAAKPPAGKSPAGKDARSMSVAEMLAAARGGKSGGAAEVPPATPTGAETAPPVVAKHPAEAPPAEAPVVAAKPAATAAPAGDNASQSQKGIITDVDGMVAYCRKVDA